MVSFLRDEYEICPLPPMWPSGISKQWSVSQKHIHLKHRLWCLLWRQMVIFSISLEKQAREKTPEQTPTAPIYTDNNSFPSWGEENDFLSSQKQSSHLVLLHFIEMGFCGLSFCCILRFPFLVLVERKRETSEQGCREVTQRVQKP